MELGKIYIFRLAFWFVVRFYHFIEAGRHNRSHSRLFANKTCFDHCLSLFSQVNDFGQVSKNMRPAGPTGVTCRGHVNDVRVRISIQPSSSKDQLLITAVKSGWYFDAKFRFKTTGRPTSKGVRVKTLWEKKHAPCFSRAKYRSYSLAQT